MACLHAIQAGPAKTHPKKDQVGGSGRWQTYEKLAVYMTVCIKIE